MYEGTTKLHEPATPCLVGPLASYCKGTNISASGSIYKRLQHHTDNRAGTVAFDLKSLGYRSIILHVDKSEWVKVTLGLSPLGCGFNQS